MKKFFKVITIFLVSVFILSGCISHPTLSMALDTPGSIVADGEASLSDINHLKMDFFYVNNKKNLVNFNCEDDSVWNHDYTCTTPDKDVTFKYRKYHPDSDSSKRVIRDAVQFVDGKENSFECWKEESTWICMSSEFVSSYQESESPQ